MQDVNNRANIKGVVYMGTLYFSFISVNLHLLPKKSLLIKKERITWNTHEKKQRTRKKN
jgi:hypothetical protein